GAAIDDGAHGDGRPAFEAQRGDPVGLLAAVVDLEPTERAANDLRGALAEGGAVALAGHGPALDPRRDLDGVDERRRRALAVGIERLERGGQGRVDSGVEERGWG